MLCIQIGLKELMCTTQQDMYMITYEMMVSIIIKDIQEERKVVCSLKRATWLLLKVDLFHFVFIEWMKWENHPSIHPSIIPSLHSLHEIWWDLMEDWVIIYHLLAYQGKDIVFRFIIEFSSLRDNRSFFVWGFLKDDILACVETWD